MSPPVDRFDCLTESLAVRAMLIGLAVAFLSIFLVMPLMLVFTEAFRQGWDLYLEAIVEPDALSAIKLTLTVAAISLPVNMAFGLAAAWAITRFRFHGKQFFITLIDLPFSISPVVALGVRAAVWIPGLVWPLAARQRHQDCVCRARRHHCHIVRDRAVYRA